LVGGLSGAQEPTNSGDRDSVVNGLQTRIPVDQAAIEQSKILKFRFELRNLGAKDLHLNVGTRSREGGRQYLIRGALSRQLLVVNLEISFAIS